MPQSTHVKEAKRYIVSRLIVLIVVPLWWLVIIWNLYRMILAEDGSGLIFVILLVPGIIPAILLTLNLGAFPWPYSAFGRYMRTPLPSGRALAVVANVPITCGRTRCEATWHIFKDGIGVSIQLIGSAYLTRDEFLSLTPARFGGA